MLGAYRLAEKIGEGGMGVVWRATDTTLDREVAIKVLPDLFAEDPDRLARFDREAKVLASLNHPGIATIHGLHEAEGIRFLAMELVPGVDLATRLAEGPIPIDEALGVALQVAQALEAAHESGVVHRDLKPANVRLTPDGKVKILDFGLAKAMEAESASGSRASLSPTLTTPAATRAGLILGTAAYMSPEQAKGKPVDRRADIWAFGCVLYEMLTGRRPFGGEGVSEVIAAVIMAPVEWGDLPATMPERIRRLVHRCLEKDPRRRLRDIGEARFLLEETLAGTPEEKGPAAVAAAAPSRRKLVIAAVGVAALSVLATVAVLRLSAPKPSPPVVRRLELPAHGPFRSSIQAPLLALSPDGRSLAYVDEGKLFVRRLARLEPVSIPTPAEPVLLFWSPDSAWVGYAATGRLWKVPAGGGESVLISDLPGSLAGGTGASWGPDGVIVFSRGDAGLYRVPARGGDFEEFLKIDTEKETDFHQPSWLPDGSGLLFASHTQGGRPDKLELSAGGKRKVLLEIPTQDIWFPVYSPTGHILYRRQPSNAGIWALPFSLADHEVTGEPFLIAPEGDVPSVSTDGTLVHVKGSASRTTQLIWVDRAGKELGPIGPPQDQWPFPELSPDGEHVAVIAQENEVNDIWIHDVERGTRTRLSADTPASTLVSWSPDGTRIVFGEGGNIPQELKLKSTDGSGEARSIGKGWGPAFSPDGRYVLYGTLEAGGDWNVHYVDLRGDGKPVALTKEAGIQIAGRLSPDGRYFAYSSDESGASEVYVKRFPGGEGKWQVSVGGGNWPRWNRKGNRLYYVNDLDLMEVDVTYEPNLRLGVPRRLFTRKPLGWILIFGWPPGFDVSPADDRFVIARSLAEKPETSGILVVENWLADFTRPE
jgi:Tol biopolymer transport system component